MSKLKHWDSKLAGVAAITLLTLALTPSTRAVLRTQLAWQVGPAHSLAWSVRTMLTQAATVPAGISDFPRTLTPEAEAFTRGDNRTALACISRHSDDYQEQMAAADTPAQAPALVARFPNTPAVYAHVLRLYAADHIMLIRQGPPPVPGANPGADELFPLEGYNSPALLAAFNGAAAQGERVDPQNAYFSVMRAAGLFAAYRDQEGVAAILRAGQKSNWNDYLFERGYGQWRLAQEVFGYVPASVRDTLMAGTVLPDYGLLRGAFRMAVYEAGHLESAGKIEEGISIRHASFHWIRLMTLRGGTVISVMMGYSMINYVGYRPGGAAPLKLDGVGYEEEKSLKRNAYCQYLTWTGHAAEERWTREQYVTVDKAGDIVNRSVRLNTDASGNPIVLTRLNESWWLGMLVLSNALGLLILASGALLVARLRRTRRSIGIAALWLVLPLLTFAVWHGHWGIDLAGQELFNSEQPDWSWFCGGPPDLCHAATLPLVYGIPFLILFFATGYHWERRRSLTTYLPRALWSLCLPLASLLLVLYVGLAWSTARLNTEANTALDSMTDHAGVYYANLLHEPWPVAGEPVARTP